MSVCQHIAPNYGYSSGANGFAARGNEQTYHDGDKKIDAQGEKARIHSKERVLFAENEKCDGAYADNIPANTRASSRDSKKGRARSQERIA